MALFACLGGGRIGHFAPLGTGKLQIRGVSQAIYTGNHPPDQKKRRSGGSGQVYTGNHRREGSPRVCGDPKCRKSAKKHGGRGGQNQPKLALRQMKNALLTVKNGPKSAFCYEKVRFRIFVSGRTGQFIREIASARLNVQIHCISGWLR